MLSAADKSRVAAAGELAESSTRSARIPLWLWAMVIAGTVLRVLALGYKSFWIDEIASVAIARRSSQAFWHFLWHDEGNMAAYYIVLRPWLHFGYSEGTVRLLSVIPGVLSIPVMYVLARRMFQERVAVLATLLFSFNACAIFISQEARAYSFVVLAVLLSTYLFVRLIESPKYGVTCAYAILTGLSCYFHYFCVLVPAAQYAAVIGMRADRRRWRALAWAAAIMVVICGPILWLIHAQDTGHISWVGPPSLLELYHLGAYLAAASGKAVGAVLLALNLALVGLFFRGFRETWHDVESRWRWMLAASLLVTPIIITLLVSIVRPAFYHRFLVICLPGWILMTALGAEQIRRRDWRVGAIAVVCGLSLVSTAILYHRVTEDWRDAVNYLIANGEPEDCVLYYESVGEFAGENYRDWLPGGSSSRPHPVAINPGTDDWEQQIDDTRHLWLVIYRAKPSDLRVDKIREALYQRKLSLKYVNSYPGVTIMEFVKD